MPPAGGTGDAPDQSLPCVRGGGTSAHTGIGRVVTDSPNWTRLPVKIVGTRIIFFRIFCEAVTTGYNPSAPVFALEQLPLHRGAFDRLPIESGRTEIPYISTRGGSGKRSRGYSTFPPWRGTLL